VQRRILVVGHDAYRAGAQIALLHLLRWLHSNYDARLTLVLHHDGELLDEYSRLLPTRVLEPLRRPGGEPPLRSIARRVGRTLSGYGPGVVAAGVGREPPDLVYANTAASAPLAAALADAAGCPALCQVHELEMSISRFASGFDDVRGRFSGYVAVSRAVERNLVDRHGVDPGVIDRIPPGIPLAPVPGSDARRADLRAALGIPGDAFVAGGAGTLDWRKGPDVFVLVAKALTDRCLHRPVRFVWVGGEPELLDRVEHDVDRLGLGRAVTFVGQTDDPGAYFATFDAFLLSSREDPFPLVCLEAGALGVPIVCFDGAGGMPELVEHDAGSVVPYLDVAAAADALTALATSEELRTSLGRRAAEKVAERCSIDVVGPRVAAVLDRHLRATRRALRTKDVTT
jgi:glycosyltransferase involved in cell wall biosynthesis